MSHHIHRRLAQLVSEIVAFDQTDAMLARDGAFHLDGALDHAMDDTFSHLALFLGEQQDRCTVLVDALCHVFELLTVEVPIPYVAHNRTE